MEQKARLARAGYIGFSLNGLCAISSGIIVNILQEKYGFNFSTAGTMLSAMSIGNMAASFAAGILPVKIGTRNTALLLCSGFFFGYLAMAFFGSTGILIAAFLLAGIAKGGTINNTTVMVGNNVADRARGLSLMHAGYATGAMLCPFLIAALARVNTTLPMVGLAGMGLILWLNFLTAGLPSRSAEKAAAEKTDFSFLKSPLFWLLTALIFCQNAAETAVNGWLVTYYKTTGLLSGTLSTYTVTIMWGATLLARLLIVFVFKFSDTFKALAYMGVGCTAMYLGLVMAGHPIVAIVMLFLFAASLAGVNPMGISGVGKMLSPASVGVLIPVAGLGQVVMPWIIGVAADRISLQTAMALNLIPCVGIFVLSLIIRMTQKTQ